MRAAALISLCLLVARPVHAWEPEQQLKAAGLTGGLIVQVGITKDSPALALRGLGERFHVRVLDADAAAVDAARTEMVAARLHGKMTAEVLRGPRLPFAEEVVNALVVCAPCALPADEMQRVLAPRGLLIQRKDGAWAVTPRPVPKEIDEWSHYLYDGSGNAVSRDRKVGPPKSFRWQAAPLHLRSHNYSAGFAGLVTAGGRVFHFLDEGTYLFDKGGTTEHWSLVARDAFNGASLWKRPLSGYGQPFFEDVSGQAVPDYVWRTPLTLNRRLVVQGQKVYVALNYRRGPLSVLDAATGRTLREIDLGGIVDEIVAEGERVICRVRTEIPLPDEKRTLAKAWQTTKELEKEGVPANEVRAELNARLLDALTAQKSEQVAAVDAASGRVLWRHDAPAVATQSLAMAGGRVVFHNYQKLLALDSTTGKVAWEYPCPVVHRRKFGVRNLLGNLLIADGKVLWTSSATGGGVCLNLADGKEIWRNPRLGETGGFAFPTGRRVVRGIVFSDSLGPRAAFRLADGGTVPTPDVGQMLTRGHHIRCFAGKATERFLILPHRGMEYLDLEGDQHMANDWLRGACSYGMMPANGLNYVTPDPCTCYAGARTVGFMALAAELPPELHKAPAADAPVRLAKGPAYSASQHAAPPEQAPDGWPMYRHDARRTGRASGVLSPKLLRAWMRPLGGEPSQATMAADHAYLVRKDSYELFCLEAGSGAVRWQKPFPGALDGPPTIVGDHLLIGCRDGHVYALRASDGTLAWRFLAAPQERLTLSGDRLENVWPVSASVLFHNGLVYAVAGRNSHLDGGVHLYALDPATGEVRHHRRLDGPWPDRETLRKGVVTETDLKKAEDSGQAQNVLKLIRTQHATGYDMNGAQADLLVTDGADLYMMKNKFTLSLEPIPLQRTYWTGLTPTGGKHLLANFGFLDDTMFHRSYWMYDEVWPGYGGGSGWAARAGTMVVIGEKQAYAAKHYTGGWYPTHKPGDGNRLVADTFAHINTSGALADRELLQRFRQYGNAPEIVRTAAPLWEATVPIIVRAMLVAPDGQGGELVFSAGIAEGTTQAEWDRSTAYRGPGKLLIHSGADGKQLAEYDLPACPVFDGLSAAEGRLLISMLDGQLLCLRADASRKASGNRGGDQE